MLSVNKKDFNVLDIATESKLASLDTQFEYRVYGLKQEGNPLILISNPFIEDLRPRIKNLIKFFNKNGMQLEVEECEVRRVSVGLRYDIRKHVILSAAILQTIIYALEGRVDLKQKFKVPGIPEFEGAVKKKEDPNQLLIPQPTELEEESEDEEMLIFGDA